MYMGSRLLEEEQNTQMFMGFLSLLAQRPVLVEAGIVEAEVAVVFARANGTDDVYGCIARLFGHGARRFHQLTA